MAAGARQMFDGEVAQASDQWGFVVEWGVPVGGHVTVLHPSSSVPSELNRWKMTSDTPLDLGRDGALPDVRRPAPLH